MLRRTLCLSQVFLVLIAVRSLAGDEPEMFLKTLPAASRVSLTIRNLEELDAHYVKHLQRENNVSPNPKQLIQMGLGFLKIRQGVNWQGTFSAAVMDWGEGDINDDKLKYLVLRIPFDNAALMGNNFGLNQADDLDPGEIHQIKKGLNGGEDLYVAFRKHDVLISMLREAIEQYQHSPPMKSVVQTDPGACLSGADVLLQTNPRAMQPGRYDRQSEQMIETMFSGESETVRERVKQVVRHTDQFFFAMNVDQGVHFRVHASLSSDLPAEVKRVLQTYAHPSTQPDLGGLPRGNLLLALSKAADREQNETIRNRSVAWMLEQTIHNKSISRLILPYLDPRDDTFHGLIDEIWNSIVEARLAVYLNENLKEDGLANLVVILRPEQPDEFVAQLSSLVKFSRGAVYNPRTQKTEKVTEEEIRELIVQLGAQEFKQRKAATLRLRLLGEPALPLLEESAKSGDEEVARRSQSLLLKIREHAAHYAEQLIAEGLTALPLPEFVFYENEREIAGFPADVLVAQWAADDPVSSKRVRELAGPHGQEILIVHVENEVVLFWGSDRTILEECLQLLQSNQPGMNEQRGKFAEYASPQRLIETHLSVQKFARMVPETFRRSVAATSPTEDFSSFSIEISPQHLIGDAYFPLPEFVLIARYFF